MCKHVYRALSSRYKVSQALVSTARFGRHHKVALVHALEQVRLHHSAKACSYSAPIRPENRAHIPLLRHFQTSNSKKRGGIQRIQTPSHASRPPPPQNPLLHHSAKLPSDRVTTKMARLSLLLAALAALVGPTAAQLGAWAPQEVTGRERQLLADALALQGAAYEPRTRLCFLDVVSLETQLVAGTNLRFVVSGVDVTEAGANAAGKCAADVDGPVGGFLVAVFQALDQSLSVTDVQPRDLMHVESFAADLDRDDKEAGYATDDEVEQALEEMDAPQDEVEDEELDPLMPAAEEPDVEDAEDEELAAAAAVSQEEKALIDEWLEENRDRVNEFGDPAGTFYTGGTPLFDESTGTSVDKYEYIARRHPDRPWATEQPAQGTLRVNMLATEGDRERAGASAGQASVGSFVKVLASLGVFGAALVAVAAVKRQRGPRRFSYHQINGRGQL